MDDKELQKQFGELTDATILLMRVRIIDLKKEIKQIEFGIKTLQNKKETMEVVLDAKKNRNKKS